MPKYALFDGDYLAHRAVYMNDANSGNRSDLQDTCTGLMNAWMAQAARATKSKKLVPILCMSLFRTKNFRHDLYKGYKASRKQRELPDDIPAIYEMINDGLICDNVRSQKGLEADDLLGIYQTHEPKNSTVIITVDKDLNQIPGHHWDPMHSVHRNISEDEGYYLFLRQWLMGDPTDCIPGIKGVGEKKAEIILEDSATEDTVLKAYEEAGYDYDYALQQGRLVRILTTDHAKITKASVKYTMWNPDSKYRWRKRKGKG